LKRHVDDTTGPFWLAFNDPSDDDRKNTEADAGRQREDHTRQDSGISR